jgi:hypothetical protein
MNLMFKNDLESANQIQLEQWQHRGMLERVNESFARFLQRLL